MSGGETGWRSYIRSMRRTARLYSKSKIGMIGLVVIVFFLLMAIFAPYLTNNNPVFGFDVGAAYSIPAWATLLPEYHGVPVTYSPLLSNFSASSGLLGWTVSGPSVTTALDPGGLLLNATISPNQTIINDYLAGHPDNPELPGGQVYVTLSKEFTYSQAAPSSFVVDAVVDPMVMQNVSAIYLNITISNPNRTFTFGDVQNDIIGPYINLTSANIDQQNSVVINSVNILPGGLPDFGTSNAPASLLFSAKGTYNVTVQVDAVPIANATAISMTVSSLAVHVTGGAFGLLGTDNFGRDVWSQLVWGSRVSLEIGIISGVGAVLFGTVIGLVAGYLGGIWDEILSRITDFFLVIPFLPLLIVFLVIIGENKALYAQVYTWVVLIFVALSWPFIGRLIRSQVLTVKERQYVEASRAVGGGTWHIIRRHILPNVMGLVYSQIALNVSGFILLEAALDYLAVSVHPIGTITWGLMLSNALPDAVSNSAASYVWWWFLPPGICIAAVSLSFVLVGFALDSIFNPRLRAR